MLCWCDVLSSLFQLVLFCNFLRQSLSLAQGTFSSESRDPAPTHLGSKCRRGARSIRVCKFTLVTRWSTHQESSYSYYILKSGWSVECLPYLYVLAWHGGSNKDGRDSFANIPQHVFNQLQKLTLARSYISRDWNRQRSIYGCLCSREEIVVIVSHNDFISLLGCLCSNDHQRYLVTYILHLAIWIDLVNLCMIFNASTLD